MVGPSARCRHNPKRRTDGSRTSDHTSASGQPAAGAGAVEVSASGSNSDSYYREIRAQRPDIHCTTRFADGLATLRLQRLADVDPHRPPVERETQPYRALHLSRLRHSGGGDQITPRDSPRKTRARRNQRLDDQRVTRRS